MILLNNSLIYITFILLQFLVEVKPQTTTSKPNLREAHTVTFIDNKLYILGGVIPSNQVSPKETFLYIDFPPSKTSFNELKWHLLDSSFVPPHRYAATIKGGANNNTLFLYGGESLSKNTMALVYTFDAQNNLWGIPKITGVPPNREVGITLTIDYNGLMYLFGGISDNSTTYTNDMFILDTINLSWKQVSSINAPSPRSQYGAVFLPNQNIIYMGGFNIDSGVFALNEVYLYDTKNDIWTTKETNGLIPSARSSFSSVLGLDGQRVIIFGGFGNDSTNLSQEESLYVLDINNFKWYIPIIDGKIPSNRAFHKSISIEKYMVVTFGKGYKQGIEDDILLLDISDNNKYIWIDLSSTNYTLIIGVIIGSSIAGIILLIGTFFFLHKRYKKRQTKILPTSVNEKNDYPQEILAK